MKTIGLKNLELVKEELVKTNVSNARFKKRLNALQMLISGLSKQEITKRLKLGKNTLTKWVKKVNENGIEDLKEKAGRGRVGVLDINQLNMIDESLKKKPQELGILGNKWTGKNLSLYIEREFKVKLRKSRVYEILQKYK